MKRARRSTRRQVRWAILALGLGLAAAGCGRDFSLPTLSDRPVRGLDVVPQRVGPGGLLEISFTVLSGGEVEVTVNGRPAVAQAPVDGRQRYGYPVVGDEGEVLNVAVTVRLGAEAETVTVQALLDAVAPPAPDVERVELAQNPPGEADEVSGTAGFASGSDSAEVEVAADPLARLPLARTKLAGDGSFSALAVGDNSAGRLYLFVLDAVGNRSEPVALDNDVVGPGIESLELSPRVPRTGQSLRLTLRPSEPLAEPPVIRLEGGGEQQPLPATEAADGSWIAEAVLGLPLGPGLLRFELVDAAGNRGLVSRALRIGEADAVDSEAVALRRTAPDAPRWQVAGRPGCAPFRALVEARTPKPEGGSTLWGVQLVGSDGSFAPIAIGADLQVGDELHLVVFDDSGADLGTAVILPDLEPPVVTAVAASPGVAGPSTLAQITVEANEPLGAETEVRVAGQEAALLSGAETERLVFGFRLVGEAASGAAAIEVRAADRANNTSTDTSGSLRLDLDPPEVVFRVGNAVWQEPANPPETATAPSEVRVEITDSSPLQPASYQIVNMRTGENWDGGQWVAASVPIDHDAGASGSFSIPIQSGAMVPEWERIELTVLAEDAVGNGQRATTHFTRYGYRFWSTLYPSYDAWPGEIGDARVVARVGRFGLCVAAFDYLPNDALVLFYSPDGGLNWQRNPVPQVTVSDASGSMAPLPWRLVFDEPGAQGLLVGTDGLLVRVDERCAATDRIQLGVTGEVGGAAWDGETAWVATEQGVFKSADGGRSFAPVDLGQTQAFWNVAVASPGRLLVSGEAGTLFESRDAGATWQVSQPLGSLASFWEIAVDDRGAIYLGGKNLLVRTTDGIVWYPVQRPSFNASGDWYVAYLRTAADSVFARFDYTPPSQSPAEVAWYRLPSSSGAGSPSWQPAFLSYYWSPDFFVWDLAPVDAYTVFGAGMAWETGHRKMLLVSNSGGDGT